MGPTAAAGALALLCVVPAPSSLAASQSQASAAPTRKAAPAQDAAAVERRLLATAQATADSFDAQRELAVFYLGQEKLDAAIPHLQRARAIKPDDYANGYDLALALLQIGKVDAARVEVKRMLAIKQTGELHNLFANVEERAGNLVEAAGEYERAAHLDPTEAHLFDWGNNLVQLRAFDAATQVFTAAISRHPQSARLQVGLGIAQYAQGQYEDAVTSFCRAADLDPSDPRAYQFLGEMYGVAPSLGVEVIQRLARFVKAQPKNALAHYQYGMALWKGQPDGAPPADLKQIEALLKRAVTLDPKLARAFLELGVLLSDQDRYAEAVPELRRAIAIEPDMAQAHYRLARAYQRTGQPELAAQELKTFTQLKGQ